MSISDGVISYGIGKGNLTVYGHYTLELVSVFMCRLIIQGNIRNQIFIKRKCNSSRSTYFLASAGKLVNSPSLIYVCPELFSLFLRSCDG